MGCMCKECRFAKSTESVEMIICDNWEAEDYGSEMDKEYDSCDSGEKDFFAQMMESEE